ncbi:MAG: D-alanyl-D-alanine carboxypeptidase/D-alanyl-D-alanine-endopeptidase [Planctomycetes bacterium]|nr:D-alanyl-D-alanine carboxypeptidase/D-alanyl-D-alanine-endopeptidase [Planctomycetota bacterium]
MNSLPILYGLSMRQSKRVLRLICALALLFTAPGAWAGPLEEAIQKVATSEGRDKARIGVHVVALDSGRVIYARNAAEKFIAASTEKLVTACAALDALGPDYYFTTEVYAEGEISDGRLAGDLLIRGGGDPTIGGRYESESASDVFRRWASALRERGIERIEGDVLVADSFFDRAWYHPHWPGRQAWKWSFAPVGALSINDNCVMVRVKPGGSPGRPAEVSLDPPSAPIKLKNLCKTASRRQAIWFDRREGSEGVKVGGYIKAGSSGYSHEVTIPNPPLYAGATLKRALEREGIRVDGKVALVEPGSRPAGASPEGRLIIRRRTPLAPVLRTMLKKSHNHYAEQTIKTIGAESSGVGSWPAGLARAGRMLRGLGFRESDFELDDGSGLSRQGRLSPALITGLLRHVRRSDYGREFLSFLSVAGEDGTLAHRLTEKPYRGNVRGKTGYLSGVGALSGYATTRSGIEVAFSIMINDSENPPGTYSMRKSADAICRAIVDHAR